MPIAFDTETFFSKKLKYGLKQQIAEEYCRSDNFDCYLVSVYDGATAWCGHPRDFCWSALEGQVILSHNQYFDLTVWQELARRKLCPEPKFAEYHCTANMTAYLCNRRALDDAIEHLFKVKLDKSARAEADGKRWPADFTAEQQAKMLKYGADDAIWCWRLWDKFSAEWPDSERRLSNQTIAQGMHGVQMDVALLEQYIIQTHEMLRATESLIPWIAGSADEEDASWDDFNIKPTSTKCIAEQCRRVGIPCPPVKADDAEGYDEWEGAYAPRHPWIQALTGWRSINKLYKTFLTVKKRLRADGSMPFSLKVFGAHTGRWSGDAKVNLQNPRKIPLLMNEHGTVEQSTARIEEYLNAEKIPNWVKAEIDFRRLIIPRRGKKMIASDLSQIEPRVLAWLTGDTELLEMIRKGFSIYEAAARTNMGYVGPKMDKASLYYKLIKIQTLGLGYGAGYRKFIAICAAGGVDISKDDPEHIETTDEITGEIVRTSGFGAESKRVVMEWRAKNQRIVNLWAKLDYAFKMSLGTDFIMKLPSGRKLRYEKVQQSVRIEKDEKTGKPKKRWVFTAGIGGRRVITYGGKLTENLVQATARDVFAQNLLDLEDAGYTVLFGVHDEAVLEVDSSVTPKEIEEVMSRTPDWMPGLPVAAEAKEMLYYTK